MLELCRSDTSPKANIAEMRAAENECFTILERELKQLGFPGQQVERHRISAQIERHPYFSQLHYTKTSRRPRGLSAAEAYAGRSNLVCILPGQGESTAKNGIALNAHIDVVAPFFPPSVSKGIVHGRGACDDKGPVASIVGALKLVSELCGRQGVCLRQNVVAMFVIDEESGGNGSLSLALDKDLKEFYNTVLVGECTGLRLHPANRGAVWYRAEMKGASAASLFELFAFVNEELEKEGTAIRAESYHPLFPERPVQTCHGILGGFGEHPSRICAEVRFTVRCGHSPSPETEHLIKDCLAAGLGMYIGAYGDKTKVMDPATGRPVVSRHYEVKHVRAGFRVKVFGAAGHMGAIRERDGALTKAAYMVRSLVASKRKLETMNRQLVKLELDATTGNSLVLEGGQGFVPTHTMEEIMDRLRSAAERGVASYLRECGSKESTGVRVEMSFEKLHNEAYASDPKSAPVSTALAASRICGLPQTTPLRGWAVSCDARLFAKQNPGLTVLTFGPGQLAFAHSDQEQISLEEVRKAAEFIAVFLLKQTGMGNLKLATT